MMESFEEDNNFYEGTLEDVLTLPEGFAVTIPPTGRAIVDEVVDNIEPYDLLVNYSPRGFSVTAQENADSVRRFIKNMWGSWRQSNNDIDILRDFIKNLVKNGKACFKLVPDWTLWPQLTDDVIAGLEISGGKGAVAERAKLIQEVRNNNFPVTARSLDPMHIMEDPSMDGRKLWVIETYPTDITEIENRYAEWVEEIRSSHFAGNYVIREVWTATWIDWDGKLREGWHWIFINNVCVNGETDDFGEHLGEPNIYHEIPFVIKHSGLGRESYDGEPELKATGFYSLQVKSMLRAEIRRVSQFDALMSQLAFPIVLIPESVGDLDLDFSPGAINPVPDEVLEHKDSLFLQARLPAPEYLQSINMIQNQIERGTTQRAVRGAGVPGTDSAAQLQMITSQAKLRLEPIKRAAEEAVDSVNGLVLRYIDTIFKEPVSVFGLETAGADKYTLKPSQIKGKYRTKTSFMPNEEQVKERKLALVTDAISKAGMNPFDAYTQAGFENPMEIIARNLAYEIMQEPTIKRALAKQAAMDWGLDVRQLEAEEMKEQLELQSVVQQWQQMMSGQMIQPGQSQQQSPDQSSGFGGAGGGGGNGAPQTEQAPQAVGAPVGGPAQAPPGLGAGDVG